MPLHQSANFFPTGSATGSWALWRIEESEEVLRSQLNVACFPLEELQQIRVAQRRLEWLSCRLALQALLQGNARARLCKNEYGRPFLASGAGHISLSHAYPFAAAALHPLQPVGLDIEQPRRQLLRIKHKFLSQQEQRWAGDDLRQLCLLWAAKEALYKLIGRPGLVFARDLQLSPVAGAEGLQAFVLGEPHRIQYQWQDSLLVCVAV